MQTELNSYYIGAFKAAGGRGPHLLPATGLRA